MFFVLLLFFINDHPLRFSLGSGISGVWGFSCDFSWFWHLLHVLKVLEALEVPTVLEVLKVRKVLEVSEVLEVLKVPEPLKVL